MTIDYKQLQALVKEAMFTGGGINEPSNPEGVPHRMPAADTDAPEQLKGDPTANKMYDIALAAREATEKLVEALDDPAFDGAYEHAFKASACLRKALNSIEESGAHPMPIQRVVAPPENQQKYTSGGGGDYAGGAMLGPVLDEDTDIDNPELEAAAKELETGDATPEDVKKLASKFKLAAAILGDRK